MMSDEIPTSEPEQNPATDAGEVKAEPAGLSQGGTSTGKETEAAPEPLPEAPDGQAAETETAQLPVPEPFPPKIEPLPESEPVPAPPPAPLAPAAGILRQLLATARSVFQSKKRKKLDRILAFLDEKKTIGNDDVEKLFHVSDATATRYLDQLEKEGKIIQAGRRGRGVRYVKTG